MKPRHPDESPDIKVMIVEDFPIVRDGFREILQKVKGIRVVEAAGSAEQAIQYLEENQVEVVLMDIRLPGMNGDVATRLIHEQWPAVKVIALTTYGDRGFIQKMLQEGAVGYMLKDSEHDELVRAIFLVHAGENYFSSKVSNILLKNYLSPNGTNSQVGLNVTPDDLTRRERDVLRLICQEKTNKEIGEALCIGTRTVDSHRRNLLQKIGARNTAGLVVFAMKHGLDQEELF